ncbi:Scr1 family TA system antitoxin-like transcriptional regulator [Streptomonospora salina]|uniref:Transcriptional regulator with XRE-family HTH domain n=1 Tax=Streptomonospora salina TaxID=104205 RepID=A0A841E0B6_9ACTN|nr:Scr1 family TA system antitoxin-like transcriptional regulator [Streptomonospora salina]MBB5996575.1 transcriptional regulator with XRE-family HTH domain [Streptomonospora salina]
MPPTLFSAALTKFRELAGLTQLQLAGRSGTAHSSVNRWENGGSLPKRDNAESLDAALDANGELLAAWRRSTTGTGLPEWARTLDAIERGARHLSIAAPSLVPGYLQCEEYARFVFASGQPFAESDELDRLTNLRCQRLRDLPQLSITAVFPLSAVAGVPTAIAQQQARYLVEWADTDRVAVHVVPSGSTMPVPTSPLMLFRLRSGEQVVTSDYADGSVTLDPDTHERMGTLFTTALAASLPGDLSVAALKDIYS